MFRILSVLIIVGILATLGGAAASQPPASCENTNTDENGGSSVSYIVVTTSGNGVIRVNCFYYPWAFSGTTPESVTAWCDSINEQSYYTFVLGFRFEDTEWEGHIKCRYIYGE